MMMVLISRLYGDRAQHAAPVVGIHPSRTHPVCHFGQHGSCLRVWALRAFDAQYQHRGDGGMPDYILCAASGTLRRIQGRR